MKFPLRQFRHLAADTATLACVSHIANLSDAHGGVGTDVAAGIAAASMSRTLGQRMCGTVHDIRLSWGNSNETNHQPLSQR
jgi:hypothetical protein